MITTPNDTILIDQDGHVVTVTMNRPEKRNAWNGDLIHGLADVWDQIDADENVRVAILTGAGGNFCAGADLTAMSGSRSKTEGDDGFADKVKNATTAFRGMLRSKRLTKPLVAAVEGYALAGGTEILQACDIRVAAESATFALAEVQRALFPVGGSTVRLQRQVPYTKAMEILLVGDRFDAKEALSIGLVGRVVPDGTALKQAKSLADRIARNGPLAVQAILRSARETADMTEEDGLNHELMIGMTVFASEDAKEGPRAFAEKREPEFRGV
jgi:enoyl-CoA hydratase